MTKGRILAMVLAVAMVITAVPMTAMAATEATAGDVGGQGAIGTTDTTRMQYFAKYADAKYITDGVKVDVLAPTNVGDATVADVEGRQALSIAEGGFAEWTFTIEKEGLYNISADYLPIVGKPTYAEMSVLIDGAVPYKESSTVRFSRTYYDVGLSDCEGEYEIEHDTQGNDVSPDAAERVQWNTTVLHDYDYNTDSDLVFYFTAGQHTLRLESMREAIAFSAITLGVDTSLPSYNDVKKDYDANGYKVVDEPINIRAEYAYEKSDQSLGMSADYTSASTVPVDPRAIRMNVIGGELWNTTGQWISWKVNVKESGLYAVSFKYKQNYVRGFKVYRDIYIDDAIPFTEFEAVEFKPNDDWENMTVCDAEGKPYYVYLTEGTHELKLQVTLGDIAEPLQQLQQQINTLNAIYRQIIQITGTTPDSYRDYDLDKNIPGLMDDFKAIRKDLDALSKRITEINGVSGGLSSFIDVLIKQLDKFIDNPTKISGALNGFKSNIASMSDMLVDMQNQSLCFDQIYVGGSADNIPKVGVGFFPALAYGVENFIASFTVNYNSIENTGDAQFKCEPIEIWMATGGRDQMNVLKALIDDRFTPEYNIPVDLSLVAVGALTKAILAGVAPDACIMTTSDQPVNYSMRGALEPLDQFEGFDECLDWFHPSAFIAIAYQDGHIYGLPETQNFRMMFYRTDIFEQLGLEAPNTWDDIYDMITVLQRQNMLVGIPNTQEIFTTLIFQNGGDYYVDDMSKTRFDEQISVDAFKEWTDFYTKYGIPLTYDALNRFRSGEIPIIIEAFTFYNNLSVGAPELKGLWDMLPIPGTVQEDGTIDRSQVSSGNVCIMIKGCENKEYVFDFLKWWVSKDAQAQFGIKVEAKLGVGGRYATANLEAFELLPWSYAQQKQIKAAWSQVWDTPKVPGDYYVTRMLNNAFRAVVYDNYNYREMLISYNKEIDKELQRKRDEYNIDRYYEN